jgi:hypothetical protein
MCGNHIFQVEENAKKNPPPNKTLYNIIEEEMQ